MGLLNVYHKSVSETVTILPRCNGTAPHVSPGLMVTRLAVGRCSDGEGRTEQPQRGPGRPPLRGGGVDAQRVQLAAGDRQAEQRHLVRVRVRARLGFGLGSG